MGARTTGGSSSIGPIVVLLTSVSRRDYIDPLSLLRARAIESQLFVVGCNRAGADADGEFGGYSAAIDPWGHVLAEAGPESQLVVVTLDLEEVERARRLFPFLNDRRPEVYG